MTLWQLRALQWKFGWRQVYWPIKCLFFDTLESWPQQGWPHRGLDLQRSAKIKATSRTYGGKPSRMSSQLGPLDFITSSTTIEDSAALLSHSKKASGSGLSVFHDFLARCITLTKQNNVCKIEKSFESNLNLSDGKWQCQLLHHYVVWVEYPVNVVHILVKHKMRILQLKVKLNLAWDYN